MKTRIRNKNLESLGAVHTHTHTHTDTLQNNGKNIIKNKRENYIQLQFDINSKYNFLFFRIHLKKYCYLRNSCNLRKYQNLSKEVA